MMSFQKKLRRLAKKPKKFIQDRKDEIERGKEVTLQMQAERLRKRDKKISEMKPGAKKTLASAFQRRVPITEVWSEVMKPELERRKYEREQQKQDHS